MSESIKRLVEAGLVLAIQKDSNGFRCCRITLQDGQLYLHALANQQLPTRAHTVEFAKVKEVMKEVNPFTLVFLDLSWPGSNRGRLHIRLTDTTLATQFEMMCMGEKPGCSYLNTKLLQVWHKGEPGECVRGGDYQHNNGYGGSPLLIHHQDDRKYKKSGCAGDVWLPYLPWSKKSTQFYITTRDLRGDQRSRVFGKVVKGLDVVKAAINHRDIREVTVMDCGVVLTL
nr:peptidyl-prolyl cis-trans isomerase-like isoform X1 [Cherax quadricarinatus]